MTSTVQIEDGAALGIARSALKAQAAFAADRAAEAIYQFKSPELAAVWAKNSARYGLAYLQLAEVKFL